MGCLNTTPVSIGSSSSVSQSTWYNAKFNTCQHWQFRMLAVLKVQGTESQHHSSEQILHNDEFGDKSYHFDFIVFLQPTDEAIGFALNPGLNR